jgi:hypothetical protein
MTRGICKITTKEIAHEEADPQRTSTKVRNAPIKKLNPPVSRISNNTKGSVLLEAGFFTPVHPYFFDRVDAQNRGVVLRPIWRSLCGDI